MADERPEAPGRTAPRLKLWIDADAAPRDVKEIVFRAARRLELEAVMVANQRLPTPPGNPFVSSVRVEGGPDVADRYIADRRAGRRGGHRRHPARGHPGG
jgi:uncharacterized protein YaiI (UPF0178 family)